MGQMVERAIDGLPDIYRSVLMLREVEGMTTEETAAVLDVGVDVVKTRLHRARAALRAAIENRVGEQMKSAFTFGNERCDRVVAAVLAMLNLGTPS
jgi:RNA polymerase sigma-70 factor (ECF subfamily)